MSAIPEVPVRLRLLVAFGCALLGVATAAASVVLHGYWWGLLLGLSATIATIVALRRGWWCRLTFAVVWSLTVFGLSTTRPEGDYLVASDLAGYLLLGSTGLVLIAGMAGLRRRSAIGAEAGD